MKKVLKTAAGLLVLALGLALFHLPEMEAQFPPPEPRPSGMTLVELVGEELGPGQRLPAQLRVVHEGQPGPWMEISIKWRGSRAKGWPKKSYAFNTKTKAWDKNRKVSLLGIHDNAKWILDGSFEDSSMLRNLVSLRLFQDLWKNPYTPNGRAVVQGRLVELTYNNRYLGPYVLSERLGNRILKLGKKGRLYKACRHTARSRMSDATPIQGGKDEQGVTSGYEQRRPDPQKKGPQWEPLDEFLAWLQKVEDKDLWQGLEGRVDRQNLLCYHLWLLVTGAANNDDNNFYLAKKKQGPFYFLPWDADLSWGNPSIPKEHHYSPRYLPQSNQLFLRLWKDPAYRQSLADLYADLRKKMLSETALWNRFEESAARLGASGAYQRNARLWYRHTPRYRAPRVITRPLNKLWLPAKQALDSYLMPGTRINYLQARFFAASFTQRVSGVEDLPAWIAARLAFLDEKLGLST